jgi:hypothetical protein
MFTEILLRGTKEWRIQDQQMLTRSTKIKLKTARDIRPVKMYTRLVVEINTSFSKLRAQLPIT